MTFTFYNANWGAGRWEGIWDGERCVQYLVTELKATSRERAIRLYFCDDDVTLDYDAGEEAEEYLGYVPVQGVPTAGRTTDVVIHHGEGIPS